MDEDTVFNDQYNEPPAEDQEREAFIHLDPPGFFIRHPPAPHKLDAFLTPDDDLFQTRKLPAHCPSLGHYDEIRRGSEITKDDMLTSGQFIWAAQKSTKRNGALSSQGW